MGMPEAQVLTDAERLRLLIFSSDNQHSARTGVAAVLQLQGFLQSRSAKDPESTKHTVRLQELCSDRLVAAAGDVSARSVSACEAALQAAQGLPGLRFPAAQDEGHGLFEACSHMPGLFSNLLQASNAAKWAAAQVQQAILQRQQQQQQLKQQSRFETNAQGEQSGQHGHLEGMCGITHPEGPRCSSSLQPRTALEAGIRPPSRQPPALRPMHAEAADLNAHGYNMSNPAASRWASHKRPNPDAVNDGDDIGKAEGSMPGATHGFQTAMSKLVSDARKNGQLVPTFANSQTAPRTGLSRPQKKQQQGSQHRGGGGGIGGVGAGSGGTPRGFMPPFVQKALDGHSGSSGCGRGPGGGGAAANQEGEDGSLSARTHQLLAGTTGELPAELQKLDPKLIEQVCSEILDQGSRVSWDDIAGQEQAKRLVQELVVWPILNPALFKGARAPPKGLLLFGPPGTGKTLIGRAIASNINATFFSISASSLNSKWVGEGEKMVRVLFAVAGCLQPSVIFIDEIDSTLSARKSEGEHESSRRLKTEMLIQMEGCDPQSADRRVLLIGATNRPEELDEAARRRLPKQLYIPLPCEAARRQMVLRQLGPGASVRALLSDSDMGKLVARTAGYSGSDMRNLVQEACQGPVRDAVARFGAGVARISEDDLRPVVLRDFQVATKAQKATVTSEQLLRYEQYNALHGARYNEGPTASNELEEEW